MCLRNPPIGQYQRSWRSAPNPPGDRFIRQGRFVAKTHCGLPSGAAAFMRAIFAFGLRQSRRRFFFQVRNAALSIGFIFE